MGKLEKFEGERDPNKEPFETVPNVGSDSLATGLIEVDRLITDGAVEVYFEGFSSLAALRATEPNPLSYEILIYGTLVEAEIAAASRDTKNASDRRKKAERRRVLMQIQEDLKASAGAIAEGREPDAREYLRRASHMLSWQGVSQSRTSRGARF